MEIGSRCQPCYLLSMALNRLVAVFIQLNLGITFALNFITYIRLGVNKQCRNSLNAPLANIYNCILRKMSLPLWYYNKRAKQITK